MLYEGLINITADGLKAVWLRTGMLVKTAKFIHFISVRRSHSPMARNVDAYAIKTKL